MPTKSKKSKSKRLSLHQKYKILKKVREHNRKKAKDAKKKGGRAKAPKDPGIPNAWPFKEQLVKELEFEREQAEAAKVARREAAKERRVRPAFAALCSGGGPADPATAPGGAAHATARVAASPPPAGGCPCESFLALTHARCCLSTHRRSVGSTGRMTRTTRWARATTAGSWARWRPRRLYRPRTSTPQPQTGRSAQPPRAWQTAQARVSPCLATSLSLCAGQAGRHLLDAFCSPCLIVVPVLPHPTRRGPLPACLLQGVRQGG